MYRKLSKILIVLITSSGFFQCSQNSITKTEKFDFNDPFKNTIVPSQTIEIDSKQDNVVEGEMGTIVVCPKGCFKNQAGEIVEGKVTIELSEAFTLVDMLLSNLTTTSNGQPLETDGMIYFNATSDGQQLIINKDNPVHFEIPTSEKKAGMMAYEGQRDVNGNMNWIEPKEIDNYLVTIDINMLDFLPEGFQTEVDKGMPYKNYKAATPSLTDSLYYQLSASNSASLTNGLIPTNYNEPFYNKNAQVENGRYASNSYLVNETKEDSIDASPSNCGIDPAIIKVIKSEAYQNTFIATREFEKRLQVIFKTCNNAVLEAYINNLDKNLFEADSLAANEVIQNHYYHDFENFAKLRLTKVKDADKYAKLLKGYYENRLVKVKADLEKQGAEVIKALSKKNKEAAAIATEYKKLLFKREKFRMETYGFSWGKTGWINIDKGPNIKNWEERPLEITVENGAEFDRVYSYVFYPTIKSIYRLNSKTKALFYSGNTENKQVLMPTPEPIVAIAIGYKNEIPAIAIKAFETISESKISLSLSPTNAQKMNEALEPYENVNKENSINTDLAYMAKFYKEEQRQKVLKEENNFINRLREIAFPCCNDYSIGEKLFKEYCSSCHNTSNQKLVGPGLMYATTKHSKDWLYQWTTNSTELLKSGDKYAINLFIEYNKSLDPKRNLSEQQVEAIFNYIDKCNRN